MRGWQVQNGVPASNYVGAGGTHELPDDAYVVSGPWATDFEVDAGTLSLIRAHCNIHGCNRWDSGVFPVCARLGNGRGLSVLLAAVQRSQLDLGRTDVYRSRRRPYGARDQHRTADCNTEWIRYQHQFTCPESVGPYSMAPHRSPLRIARPDGACFRTQGLSRWTSESSTRPGICAGSGAFQRIHQRLQLPKASSIRRDKRQLAPVRKHALSGS